MAVNAKAGNRTVTVDLEIMGKSREDPGQGWFSGRGRDSKAFGIAGKPGGRSLGIRQYTSLGG